MKLVLFLGAGFSRPFGLPVMNSFFEAANSLEILTPDQKQFLRNLREETRKGASMLSGGRANLEHVLSFCFSTRDVRKKKHNDLCEILRVVYSNLQLTALEGLVRNAFPKLIGLRDETRNHTYTIITTNYDVCAEIAINSSLGPPALPGTWKSSCKQNNSGNSLYRAEKPNVVLCKLHGSLNWFPERDAPANLYVVDEIVQVQSWTEENPKTHFLPKACLREFKPEIPPLIVPPTFFKEGVHECVEAAWDTAANAIRTADRLAFVGYSFPMSDTYMRYFFARTLLDNIDLSSVDIVDPNATSIVAGLSHADKGFGDEFKQLLKPINLQWESANYSVIHGRD